MRNKFIVMFFTFLFMIAITPFVFGKLMNAKFNKMLENLKKQGIEIKEIKNKSSYIQTDRVFKVKIPGKNLNLKEVDYIGAIVETKFKNLPVTTVDFLGDIKELKLKSADLTPYVKDKIKFIVITPNFKVYNYKVFDGNIVFPDSQIKWEKIKGTFKYPSKNYFESEKIKLIFKNLSLSIENLKNDYQKEKEFLKNLLSFDSVVEVGKNKFFVRKVFFNNVANFNTASLDINGGFDNLTLNDFKVKKVDLNLSFYEFNKELFYRFIYMNDEKAASKLFKENFKFNGGLSVKELDYLNKNLGFLKLKANGNKEDFNITLSTTQQLAGIIIMFIPQMAIILNEANVVDDKIYLKIEVKKGKIIVNGKSFN